MKVSELRMGNWVTQPNVSGKVSEVWGDAIRIDGQNTGYDLLHTYPIPLTAEWLERLGFEKYKKDYGFIKDYFDDSYYKRYILIDDPDWFKGPELEVTLAETKKFQSYDPDNDISYDLVWVEYVHQLQNLYFALTGEELDDVKLK